MQVIGKYIRFWDSENWEIKIDYFYEISKENQFKSMVINFKNIKTNLINSFEVLNLCACVNLIRKFAEGFNLYIYNERLLNWHIKYFKENHQKIKSQELAECFSNENLETSDNKIKVTVKKLTNKKFSKFINYDPDDLIIDFNHLFDKRQVIGISPTSTPIENLYSTPLRNSTLFYSLKNKKIKGNFQNIEKSQLDLGKIKITKTFPTGRTISNIKIIEYLSNEYSPNNIYAKLFAPDRSQLGIFQPVDIKEDEYGLQVIWNIEELKQSHFLEFTYIISYRSPILFTLVESTGLQKYLVNSDINYIDNENYEIIIPKFEKSGQIIEVELFLPIEFETNTFLNKFPNFFSKLIDLGFYQKVILSEEFNHYISEKSVLILGEILPVLSIFESLLPSGSKLSKKLLRCNSLEDPLVFYELNNNSFDQLVISEIYSKNTIIESLEPIYGKKLNLITKKERKLLTINLDSVGSKVAYVLKRNTDFNLEKSINQLKNPNQGIDYRFELKMIFEKLKNESLNLISESNKFNRLNLDSYYKIKKYRERMFDLNILEKIEDYQLDISKSGELDSALGVLNQSNNTNILTDGVIIESESEKEVESLSGIDALKSKIKDNYLNIFTGLESSDEVNFESKEPTKVSSINEIKLDEKFVDKNDFRETKIENSTELRDKSSLDDLKAKILQNYSDSTLFNKESKNLETNSDLSINKKEEIAEERTLETPKIKEESDLIIDNQKEIMEEGSLETTEIKKKSALETQVEKEDFETATEVKSDIDVENILLKDREPTKVPKPIISNQTIINNDLDKSKEPKIEEFIDINLIFVDNTIKSSKIDLPNESQFGENLILLVDDTGKKIENSKDHISIPFKIYLKVPKGERYNILLMNPNDSPSSHLYGKWRNKKNRKIRVSINLEGIWFLKIQLLESGNQFELKIKR